MNSYLEIVATLLSVISLLVTVLTSVFAWISIKRRSAERLIQELELKKLELEMERSKREIDAKNLNLKNAELIVELLTGKD
jgi:sensor domain CHASE-containing protein